ncbi:transglutaminase-like domain-containing protein [Maribacter confluentis]
MQSFLIIKQHKTSTFAMMPNKYEITYTAENHYDHWVYDAYWQFLIIPMENQSQFGVEIEFYNSLYANIEYSTNGYGFKTIRIHPKKKFDNISFKANFEFFKKEENPFNFPLDLDILKGYKMLEKLDFKISFERFLKATQFTQLEKAHETMFIFDPKTSIFDNLQALNDWTFKFIQFKTGVTDVDTLLTEIVSIKQGVCQDFTHLFCALARKNGVPTRYVSGYLNQGSGFFGDSQMHAWAEAYIPEIGWKGFDPTNNILANINHIKVCHGKDYNDCAPLKGVVYSQGRNQTSHTVTVQSQQ